MEQCFLHSGRLCSPPIGSSWHGVDSNIPHGYSGTNCILQKLRPASHIPKLGFAAFLNERTRPSSGPASPPSDRRWPGWRGSLFEFEEEPVTTMGSADQSRR